MKTNKLDLEESSQDLIDELMDKKLNFCSCGNPEEIDLMIESILKSRESYTENLSKLGYDENTRNLDDTLQKEFGFTSQSVVYEFILKTLDGVGLLEHGSSIYGAWVTPYGKEILKAYEILKDDSI